MKRPILLDTHMFIWALMEEDKLPLGLKVALLNPRQEVYVSSASAWEMSIKYHLGKLPLASKILNHFNYILEKASFVELPMSSKHSMVAGALPPLHRDPFDRMMIAQAQSEKMWFATLDPVISNYDVDLFPVGSDKKKVPH